MDALTRLQPQDSGVRFSARGVTLATGFRRHLPLGGGGPLPLQSAEILFYFFTMDKYYVCQMLFPSAWSCGFSFFVC